MTDATPNIKRRTLMRGAAWTAPVISVAAMAPRAAASPQPCIPEFEICGEYTGIACKHPGNPKWYHFTFCFTNTGDAAATVTFVNLEINGVDAPNLVPSSVSVPADGLKHCYYVDGGLFGNSANGNGALTFSVGGIQATIPISVAADNALPPCGTGADPCGNPSADPANPGGHTPIGPCGVPNTPACGAPDADGCLN